MRKQAWAGLLFVLLLLVGTASAAPVVQGQIGARYEWFGSHGTLSIAQAEGLPFAAWDSRGLLVARGVVGGPLVHLPACNSGPGEGGVILLIQVGGVQFQAVTPDWMWE